MDVLQTLRDFCMRDQLDQVAEVGGRIDFGGMRSFDKNVLTTYKSNQGKEEFYDLQTLLYFARSLRQGLKYKDYFRATVKDKLMRVKALDGKDVENYLMGKVDTVPAIQLSLPPEVAQEAKEARAQREQAEPGAAGAAAESEEQAALRAILANEHQLRDRNTMLSVPNRSFRGVLDILDGVLAEQEARLRQQERKGREEERAAKRQKPREPAAAAVVSARPSGRYQRETATDAALKQIGAQNLGLQQVGFAAAPEAPDVPPPPPPPPEQPGPSREAPPPAAAAAAVAPPRERRPAPAPSSSRRPPPPSRPVLRPAPVAGGASPRRQGTPIIIVPAAMTALLNIFNAPDFFARGKFRTAEEAQAAGAQRPLPNPKKHSFAYVPIQRTEGRPGEGIRYHITDQEPKKDSKEWERVVAVVAFGKPWQFKGWPFKGAASGDMVDTFQRVCGFYLHYADTPPDALVKGWNVKAMGVSRHSREQDRQVARDFWRHLDAFLKAKDSTLMY